MALGAGPSPSAGRASFPPAVLTPSDSALRGACRGLITSPRHGTPGRPQEVRGRVGAVVFAAPPLFSSQHFPSAGEADGRRYCSHLILGRGAPRTKPARPRTPHPHFLGRLGPEAHFRRHTENARPRKRRARCSHPCTPLPSVPPGRRQGAGCMRAVGGGARGALWGRGAGGAGAARGEEMRGVHAGYGVHVGQRCARCTRGVGYARGGGM